MGVHVEGATGVDRRGREQTVGFAAELEGHGDRVAAVDEQGTAWTYAELARRADQVAIRIGTERCLAAVVARADVTSLIGYLGALRGGHPVLMVPPDDPESEARLLSTYRPDVVVHGGPEPGTPEVERRSDRPAHALHPDLALLLSTSGSTGSPKLVRLSHANLQANVDAIASYLGLGPDDRAAMSLPLHYCYGLSVVHSHLAVGASLVMAGGSLVDRCFWDRFRSHRCTSFAGVPHSFELLERAGFDRLSVPTLRHVTQAGGKMPAARVQHFAELARRDGWDLFVMYGQTEATARMAYLPPELAATRPECIGRPIPGGALRIEAVPGVAEGTGELVYTGPNVMLGYAHDVEDLARGREVDELRTGDLARMDAEGVVEIVGRVARFAKLFGVRVDLDHVERLLADSGIDALCAGTDQRLALAVAGDGAPALVARSIARDLHLPAGAVHAVHVDDLPWLDNGKPDHRSVLALVEADVARSAALPASGSMEVAAADRGATRRTVRQVYAEALDVGSVGPQDTFVSLGGDSLSYVEVSAMLEELVGELPDGWHTMTVEQLEHRRPKPGRLRSVEGNVVLRAAAIIAIVGTHSSLFHLQGGAHLLLAVAGYNFARFRLTATEVADRLRHSAASIARIAVPAVIWVCFMFTWREPFTGARLALLDNVLGDGLWRYWYVEVVLQLLVVLTAVFSLRSVRHLERRHPYRVALGALGIGLVLRFGQPLGAPEEPMYRTDTVAWAFLLGWAIQRARTVPQRLMLSGLALIAVADFFDSAPRGRLVALGILALVWIPRVRLPRPVSRLVAPLAGASLYIFLTHFATLPLLRPHLPPWAVVVAALAVGIAVDSAARRLRPGQWFPHWRGNEPSRLHPATPLASIGSDRATRSTSDLSAAGR